MSKHRCSVRVFGTAWERVCVRVLHMDALWNATAAFTDPATSAAVRTAVDGVIVQFLDALRVVTGQLDVPEGVRVWLLLSAVALPVALVLRQVLGMVVLATNLVVAIAAAFVGAECACLVATAGLYGAARSGAIDSQSLANGVSVVMSRNAIVLVACAILVLRVILYVLKTVRSTGA